MILQVENPIAGSSTRMNTRVSNGMYNNTVTVEFQSHEPHEDLTDLTAKHTHSVC